MPQSTRRAACLALLMFITCVACADAPSSVADAPDADAPDAPEDLSADLPDSDLPDAPAPPVIASVQILGAPTFTLVRGEARALDVLSTGQGPVRWRSDAPQVASVSDDGRVVALEEGEAQIEARDGRGSDTVRVQVRFDADALAVGQSQACALLGGRVWCWGASQAAEVPLPDRAQTISAGATHACALLADGAVWCWGDNARGQLGPDAQAQGAPPTRAPLPAPAQALCAGGAHTCAALEDGQTWCWGDNARGQLGRGAEDQSPAPAPLVGALGPLVGLACGGAHTCGHEVSGDPWCWGANDRGQLGTLDLVDRPTPTPIPAIFRYVLLTAGEAHTCGLSVSGTPMCWGANDQGQLGEGTTRDRDSPIFLSAPERFTGLSAGRAHTCAQGEAGRVLCWGDAARGQLGGASVDDTPLPLRVEAPALIGITAGADVSLGIDASGDVWGWGDGTSGLLGPDQDGRLEVASPVRLLPR